MRICILGAGAPGCAIGAASSDSESGLVGALVADGVLHAGSTVSRLAPN